LKARCGVLRCAKAPVEFARESISDCGPWVHIPWGDRVGEANLGDAANLDTDLILLRWFDHWLKDSGDFKEEPRIRYFALGPMNGAARRSGRAEAAYPLICGQWAEMPIRARAMDGLAKDAPEGEEPRDVFVYDPEVPVLGAGRGAGAERAVRSGGDGDGQQSAGLYVGAGEARDGDLRAAAGRLYAATSAAHADFTAKLVRVTARRTRGVSCDRYRAEFVAVSRCQAMRRTSACKWEFTLEPIAFVLAAGEKPAAGDRELGVSTLRPQSIDGYVAPATCGQLELGALDATGAAFGLASLGALSACEGRAGMVTQIGGVLPEIVLRA
jgi:predicted acyl esterase